MDPQHQGFRDRAKREDERFLLATDTEFWLVFCFRQARHPARFTARLGLELDGRYVPGPDLTAAVGDRTKLTPAQRVKQMLRIQSDRASDLLTKATPVEGQPEADPLADVPETGHIGADSLAELRAIHQALNAPPPANPADVLDSPHWFAAYWPSRAGKEDFLTCSGLDVLGDKYLDGHQAARILGIDV